MSKMKCASKETIIDNLRVIYSECNEHLRATDQKKNQVIYFYILLIGAYYAVSQYFAKITHCIFVFGYLILVVIGIFVTLITTWYVVWHDVYVNTSIILQHLIMNQDYVNPDGSLNHIKVRKYLSEFVEHFKKDYTGTERKIRTEFLLIWLIVLLTSFNLATFMLFTLSVFNIYKESDTYFIFIILILMFLVCVIVSYSITYLCQNYEKSKMLSILKNSWLLKF